MKKWITLLTISMLFTIFYVGASAECNHVWERSSLDDRQYDDQQHYACYECQKCSQQKFELENHDFETLPSTYTYWDKDTCQAQYRCKICAYYQKRPIKHNWEPLSGEYSYSHIDDIYHEKTTDYKCTQCDSTHSFDEKQKHTYKYSKGSSYICCKCSVCDYIYGNRYIKATGTAKKSVKKGKKTSIQIAKNGLYGDTITKYKILSGKKNVTVKRSSEKKITIKGKKKGTTKIRVSLKSGAVYTCVVKVK